MLVLVIAGCRNSRSHSLGDLADVGFLVKTGRENAKSLRHDRKLSALQPVAGNCVANALPALLCVASQEQIVLRCDGSNEIGYLPQMLASMIRAHRHHGVVLPQQFSRSGQRLGLRTFRSEWW